MSSLNLELALTQNIYESLMKAKSSNPRPSSPSSPSSFQGERPRAPAFPNLQESLVGINYKEDADEAPTPAFIPNAMLMSFHPKMNG